MGVSLALALLYLWREFSWVVALRAGCIAVLLAAGFVFVGVGVWVFAAAREILEARRSRRKVAREWRERHPTGRDEFLAECGIGGEGTELSGKIAIVLREVLADLGGGLPPETIRADDSLAEPIWDNLWWSDVYFGIEIRAEVKLKEWGAVDRLAIDQHRARLRVRDLVRAVMTEAVPIQRTERR